MSKHSEQQHKEVVSALAEVENETLLDLVYRVEKLEGEHRMPQPPARLPVLHTDAARNLLKAQIAARIGVLEAHLELP